MEFWVQESAQSVFPLTQKEESAADKSAAVPLMILKAFPSEAPAVHSDTNLRECIRPRDTSLGIQGRLQGLMDQDLCQRPLHIMGHTLGMVQDAESGISRLGIKELKCTLSISQTWSGRAGPGAEWPKFLGTFKHLHRKIPNFFLLFA